MTHCHREAVERTIDEGLSVKAITSVPATGIEPDTNLGSLPLPVNVGQLSESEIEAAFEQGVDCAGTPENRHLVRPAYLCLRGRSKVIALAALLNHSRFIAPKEAVHA